ncbi:MAG TPA: hypothetical protein VH459_11685 [Gaiellales bacterium]|jgi:hypothetical protein
MGLLLVILMIAIVGPLALAYGADSRDTAARRRSWWPASPR